MGRKEYSFIFVLIVECLILSCIPHDAKALSISNNSHVPMQRLRMLEEKYASENPQKSYADLKELSRYTNITALMQEFVEHKLMIKLSENRRYYTIKATVAEPYFGHCFSYLATPNDLIRVNTYPDVAKKCAQIREEVIFRKKLKDMILTLISFSPLLFPIALLFRSFISYMSHRITFLRLTLHFLMIFGLGLFLFFLGLVIRRLMPTMWY